MINNGFFNFKGLFRSSSVMGVFVVAVVAVTFLSCRTNKQVVESSQSSQKLDLYQQSGFKRDTLNTTAATVQKESGAITSDEEESVDIKIYRDSDGRVCAINKKARKTASQNSEKNHTSALSASIVGSSSSSEIAGHLSTESEREKKTEKTVKTGIDRECIIGWLLIATVIILFLADSLYKIWKKWRAK